MNYEVATMVPEPNLENTINAYSDIGYVLHTALHTSNDNGLRWYTCIFKLLTR